MADKDLPDYMRGLDGDDDWGFVAVPYAPKTESVDPKVVENSNIEIAKVKSDVGDIKSMMNEIMQIVNEKETVTKTVTVENVLER